MARKTTTPGWLRAVKRRLPIGIKRLVKDAWQQRTFSRALHQVLALPPGELPTGEMLMSLRAAWGNEGWSGSLDYLQEVSRRAATTTGPVLECGSGLTTILLGSLAGRRGIEVWTLENLEEWQRYVSSILKRNHISGVSVCLSPLTQYRDFEWYVLPPGMPEDFELVVCDGPGVSYASRYGLLPLLRQRLTAGALILVDDSSHMADLIDAWLDTMPVKLVTRGPRFSVLRSVEKDQLAESSRVMHRQ